MKWDSKILDKSVNAYLLFKFWYGRGSSHAELVLSMFNKVGFVMLLLKVAGIPWAWLVVLGIVGTILIVLLGWLDDVHGVASKETSIANLRNKEIQTLLSRKVK